MEEKENKLTKFKNWFFKGRIDKATAKREIIEKLSKEYDEDKIINMNEMIDLNGRH